MPVALVNGRVLGDTGIVDGRAVLLDGDRIVDVVASDDARCKRAIRHDLGGHLLLPGFLDTQVNGGGGVLFNAEPTVDAIREIGRAHRRFGTTGFLPTLISDDLMSSPAHSRPYAPRSTPESPACSAFISRART